VILYDGVCNLCNATVLFVIDRDPHGRFAFAALQSPAAAAILLPLRLDPADLDSVVLVEDGRAWTRSAAALRVARGLRRAWPLLYAFIVVPRPLRDAVYDLVARRRYRWFGRSDACRVPTPALASRFLENGVA
jgi:predicted DCC family thiol-disulfide oxidoreductase YuxK